MMKRDYNKDHLIYDSMGLKEIKCLCCDTLIAQRNYVEMPDKKNIGKLVNVMTTSPQPMQNCAILTVRREDQTKSEVYVCKSCAKGNLDLEKIGKQIENAWRLQLKHDGMSEKDVEAGLARMNFKIKARIE